ncbi:MAG: type VI secretion system contractile sheath small subunit [Pseudomonadota bacterium]
MPKSGQEFIRQTRTPRVQIGYEVSTGDATRKVELPFKMGVMSDLSGKSHKELDPLADREMKEFNMDNFDAEMADVAPRVATTVENTLTGEGRLGIDLTFESMDDFNPGEIAKKVPAMAELLDQRDRLKQLLSYMDGKAGAEQLLEDLLQDKNMQEVLAAAKAERAKEQAAEEASSDSDEAGDDS